MIHGQEVETLGKARGLTVTRRRGAMWGACAVAGRRHPDVRHLLGALIRTTLPGPKARVGCSGLLGADGYKPHRQVTHLTGNMGAHH
jgi:hypothetical protein